MLIIADRKLPGRVKRNLRLYGDLLELASDGITYPAISGHPDIFFAMSGDRLIIAPNLPSEYIRLLERRGVAFIPGDKPIGEAYPHTARFNAVITEKYLIHNLKLTDGEILKQTSGRKRINVAQGYCRCNLIPLKEDRFITSDIGIKQTLDDHDLTCLYVDPRSIVLPGFRHGFIGGAGGIMQDKIFFTGRLGSIPSGRALRVFLSDLGYEIMELNDGPLVDGGSIMFVA
jgi:hypothetical protein